MPTDAGPPLRPDPQLILGRLDDVAGDLESLDLDEIDGEFYWRCCRADLWAPIAAHRAAPAPPWRSPAELAATPPFAYLRTAYEEAGHVTRLYHEVRDRYPRDVFGRLLFDQRVPMRLAQAWSDRNPGGESRVLRVYSGAWTGADVERAFFEGLGAASTLRAAPQLVAAGGRLRPRNPRAAAGPAARRTVWRAMLEESRGRATDEVSLELRVEFRLFTDPAAVPSLLDGTPRVPFVEVRAPRPVPPPGVIAREYEGVVRGDRRWHLVLPGVASRQDKEVALRTWAVGLLAARGDRVADAMRSVSGRAGIAEVSQSRFGQDRQRLLERVPEARPYLLARDGGHPALAKGEPDRGPLQP